MGSQITEGPFYKIYRADGTDERIEGDINDIGLDGMQKLVGGLIELVRFQTVYVDAWEMIIDEEGLYSKGEPMFNHKASEIAGLPIVGDAVVLFNHGLN